MLQQRDLHFVTGSSCSHSIRYIYLQFNKVWIMQFRPFGLKAHLHFGVAERYSQDNILDIWQIN